VQRLPGVHVLLLRLRGGAVTDAETARGIVCGEQNYDYDLTSSATELLIGDISAALAEARREGAGAGIEAARRKIDSVRFERYAVAEPGAAYKWQAALELADDVRALDAASVAKESR